MPFFCGWLMGFLPYVATKCTANKKKNHPEKSSYTRYQTDTPFHNGTAAKKATRTSSADFRAHRRCLYVDFASIVTIKGDRTCASSGWKSQTDVKTKRQNHLRHASKPPPPPPPKKKGIRIDSRKSQAGVIWNFAVALSLAIKIVQYRRNILRGNGNKNYY